MQCLITQSFWRNGRNHVQGTEQAPAFYICASDDEARSLIKLGVIAATAEQATALADEDSEPRSGDAAGVDQALAAEQSEPQDDSVKDDEQALAAEAPAGRLFDFGEAVKKLERDNEGHFTKAGLPDVSALADVGFVCSAAERTTLWAAYLAQV